jgi:hypothetical protein
MRMQRIAPMAALFAALLFQHHCDFAPRLLAQAAQKSILGAVTDFKVESLEIGVKPDRGDSIFLKFGPETEVVRIAPGERDMSKAKPAKVTDIARGDRVMVSFVEGLTEARRIVVISADDIAARNEAERLDWQKRGISGIVAAKNDAGITLEIRTPGKVQTVALAITPRTNIRRYAPGSVKFTEARPSDLAEISVGDQLRTRGWKNEDGSQVTADDIVFGTFLTRIGAVTAVHAEAGEVEMQELSTKQPLTVCITAGSRLKMLPDMREMFKAMMSGGPAHHDGPQKEGEKFDLARTLEQLPTAAISDLKVGGAIVVTSTAGTENGKSTAIMLLANADSLVQFAQMQSADHPGESPLDAINRMHGGILSGPHGVSLPALIP